MLLAACGGQEHTASQEEKADDSLIDAYVTEQTHALAKDLSAERRAELAHQLQQLQRAAAKGEGVPGARERAEFARLESLARSAAEAAGVFAPLTDAELQQAYQDYVRSLPANEYHAAHVLVASEIVANAVIAELNTGEPFAEVARKHSADDSKSKGGDLGWIHPGHLPSEIFVVLATLKAGAYSATPIKTAYGWHVLKLIETRPANPPPFDQVKAQLAANIQQERYQQFLRSAAASTN